MAPAVTVVVPYTGEPWKTWAHERAIPSAERLGVPVVIGEGETVAEARNNGLGRVVTEWVCHLDADDELSPGYFDAMATGSADVRAPSVEYVNPRARRTIRPPVMPEVWGHRRFHDQCVGDCLPHGNWIVVGALVRTELVQRLRWQEEPIFEDWSLWLRCWKAGATFEAIPTAVYRAWSARGGRNSSLPLEERNRVHGQILRSVLEA
jgi:hypothetical protein